MLIAAELLADEDDEEEEEEDADMMSVVLNLKLETLKLIVFSLFLFVLQFIFLVVPVEPLCTQNMD